MKYLVLLFLVINPLFAQKIEDIINRQIKDLEEKKAFE